MNFELRATLVVACLAAPWIASAHVVLPAGGATAGSTYRAQFIVGHACQGASATTALRVRLPAGVALEAAPQRPGWNVQVRGDVVTWTATSPADAQPGTAPAAFTLATRLPATPQTLWFPALQTCDTGSADWAMIPTAADPKPQFPAPRLDVLAPGVAALDVRGARAQPTVAGQRSTTVFMRLSAPSGARLLSVATPDGQAALHEMQMSGDVMRMRELPDGIDLPPGQPVELTPGTRHIMVTGLTHALAAGSSLALTLHVVDREGRAGDLTVQVPVAAADAMAAPMEGHRH